MKTFQKIALVSAIAAAPFAAQAELVSMDEVSMGNTTGQAGVTIEIDIEGAGIGIGSVVYTDEGSLSLNNISITGTNAAGDANQKMSLTQTVDVLANGDLALVVSPTGGEQYLNISVGDVRLQAAADTTGAAASELVNNLDMTVKLTGNSTTTIHNVDVADTTDGLVANGAGFYANNQLGNFGVTGTAANSTAGLVISQDAKFQIDNLDVGLFGYTEAQADVLADTAAYGGNGDGSLDASETANAGAIASRAAVSITGLKLNNNGGAINLNQKIWADSTGVSIQIGAFDADLSINAIAIGGASIGSLAVNDISMAGITQKIYGH